MVDPEIVKSVKNYLSKLPDHGVIPEFGVIFGSQVTGNTHEWSDIDLMVVSSLFDESPTYETIGRLWRATVGTDTRIEPIACGSRQWREDDGTPIIEIVRQEGVIVYPEAEDVRQAG